MIKYYFQFSHIFANQGLVWLGSLVGETLALHLKKELQNSHIPTALITASSLSTTFYGITAIFCIKCAMFCL